MAGGETKMTVPEAARRLGLAGGEVYRLIFRGELPGVPGEDGAVYVSAASVSRYMHDHPSEPEPTR